MGEVGDGAEVFKNLFGGFSGSLSLFTNNPYQRANTVDVPNVNADSKESLKKENQAAPNVNANSKESLKKEKLLKPIVAAEKKKKKKKSETDAGEPESSIVRDGGSEDSKKKKKKGIAADDALVSNIDAPLNAESVKKLTVDAEPVKKLTVMSKEKEKRSKRKVVEEEIQEDFEKKFRGLDGKKAKNEAYVHSEDPEIDSILHESLQEEEKKQGKRKFEDEDDGIPVRSKKKMKKTKEEIAIEEEKLLRTIFVGNLPTTVKKKQIIREFSQFGKVASARLRSVALVDTKLPRKAAVITGQFNEKRSSQNAYVVFEEVQSAKAALVHNMAEFQGKHIRVDMATAPRKVAKPGEENESEYDRSRTVFVGNVPFDVEEEDVHKAFANENPDLTVEAVRIPRDPQTSISKGFGFVCFKTKAGANAALAKKSAKIGTRDLRVVRMGSQQRLKPKPEEKGRPKHASRQTSESVKKSPGPWEGAKKGPLPWEGARAAKSDGKLGKGAVRHIESKQGGTKTSGDPAPKMIMTKRPAVLARKQAALHKAGMGPAPPKQRNTNRQGGGKAKRNK